MNCPFAPDCQAHQPTVETMTAHLAESHGLLPQSAGVVAVRLNLGLSVDGMLRPKVVAPDPAPGLTRIAPTPKPTLPVELSRPSVTPRPRRKKMARPCGNCGKVGHGQKDCPERLEAEAKKKKAKKVKRADVPATRGGGPKPTTHTGLPSFTSAITFLDTQIEAAEERLAKMRAAREALAWMNGAEA